MKKDSFLGTGWSFPPTFHRTSHPSAQINGSVEMVSNEKDIEHSLRILFDTRIGERVMRPSYGASFTDQIFEPLNPSTLAYIEDMVRTAIVYHEPRVKLDGLTIQPSQQQGNLRIDIEYKIRGTNSRFNFVYPYYLNESGQSP